jgi:hypothetical protein
MSGGCGNAETGPLWADIPMSGRVPACCRAAPHERAGGPPAHQRTSRPRHEMAAPELAASSGLPPLASGLSPLACGLWPSYGINPRIVRTFAPPRVVRTSTFL